MATISLCTTSTLLSQANEILDTHINLLRPFSQNIVRLPCATEAHRMGYETGPLVPPEGTLVIDGVSIDTLLHRFERSKRFKDEGKVVLVKNGGKAWEGKALVHGDSDSDSRSIPIEDVYIVFQTDVHTPQPAESASNALAVLATTRASPNQFTILTAGRTVLEIQSHLRAIISQFSPKRLTGLSSDMMFKPFVHRQSLKVVVALGGLSECGKSTMGAAIDVMFGARGRREKFGYLLNNATRQTGIDVYTLPDAVQGQLLVQEIEDYSKAHFWISILSLESLHRFDSIREVKRILGPLLQIVYVDVDEEERIRRQVSRVGPERAEAKIKELKDKDVMKRSRGADRVPQIADLILDNNGNMEDTLETLRAFLAPFVEQ